MELVEEVNTKVGIRIKETVSPGQVMKAMILNGLGFLSAPIYLFDTFFVGKATEHLIGEGVTPEKLNDDRIGRALDKYYQAGTTKIFTAIALKAVKRFQVEIEERSPRQQFNISRRRIQKPSGKKPKNRSRILRERR